MKGSINRINIGNALLAKKIAIAVVLVLMVVIPAVSVQGVSTTLTVNADPFIGFSSLTSSLNPSVYGDTVTFTAVVSTSGGAPTGKVIFVEFVLEGWNMTQILLGEDTTAVSLGGDSYEYTFSTSTLAIGDHAVVAAYEDGSGAISSNSAGPISQTVTDQIWPTVTITSAPSQISYSTQATFEFSSDTAGAEFECSLSESYDFAPDNWTWSACTSPKVYTGLSLGGYYWFGVKAQGAPITESTMAVHQWYIGVPQISITGGPEQYIESTEATLTFSSNPVGVDLVCSLLEYDYSTQSSVTLELWVPCTSPRTYTGLSHGNAYYFGVKPAGATDAYAVSRQWMVTRLTLTSSPNPSQFGSDVTFTATLWDDSGTTPGGTVSIMEMIYVWPGALAPQYLGSASGPIASGTGSYAYTFSTSALAVGSHEIIAIYTVDEDSFTSLPITHEVTEVTAQAPVITSQPANYTTCAGSSVSFTAAASGTPMPTVQWQTSNDGGTTWNNISGATTGTYTFTAAAGDSGKRYRAVFTNSAGSATTSAAILTVNTMPSVTTQPANQTVTYGAPSATFSTAASGTAPSVRWYRSTNGTTWELVSGATTSNLTIANPTVLMSGTSYKAVFSNACGTATSSAATLTVNKASVTAAAGSYTGTYDGAAQSPSDCTVTGAYTGDLSCTNNPASVGPDVGSGSVAPVIVLNGETETNFTITSQNGSWEITPAAVTITTGDYTSTYDGVLHSPSECTVIGDYKGDLNCTNDPASVGPDVGSGSVVPVLILNGETATNFTVIPQNGSWSITPAAVTATAGDYSGTYNGATHSPTVCVVTGAYKGDLSCTNDPASIGPDVGSDSVAPVLVLNGETATNFTVTPQTGFWEITQATVTATAGDYNGTYDGETHSPSACEVTGVYMGDLSCTNDPSLVGPDVGSGIISPVVNGTGLTNFIIDPQNGVWEITLANPICSINGYTGVYDGDPHGASGSCLGVKAETLAGLTLGDSFTNVPGGTTQWTFTDETGNYYDDSGTVNIVINKAVANIVVAGYEDVYDGQPHGATLTSATGVNREDLSGSVTVGTETFTNVPGGQVAWSFEHNNYEAQNGTVGIVINKAAANIVVAGYEGVYDSQPHGASLTSATGVNSENLSAFVTVGTETYTNVPGGQVAWSFEHNNYEAQSSTVDITINKAVANIVVAGYEGVYDGQPHGATLTSATGVNSEDLSSSVTVGTDTFTNVPGGQVSWNFEHNNYEPQNGTVDIVINKATLIVTADDQTAQYSDDSPKITFTYSGFIGSEGPDDLTTKPTCSTTREIMSPSDDYPITCAGGYDNNYTFRYIDGTFTVTKESAGITYTGDTQVTTAKVGAKVSVTFAAVLEEAQDSWLGNDLAGQNLLFEIFNFGDTSFTTPVASCTATIDHVVDGKGYGSCSIDLSAADPYQVRISLATNGFYHAGFESVVVLVNDPGTGMANGGGWLIDPNTDSRVSFGFTAKFLKNGRVQGNSLFIYRVTTDLSTIVPGAPTGERDYNWIIKSNAMQGLFIYDCTVKTTSGCKATITGKNTVQAVDRETGVLFSIGGNYQFQVDVTDNQDPGSSGKGPDQYAIRVWDSSGTYYELGDSYDDHGMLISPLDIASGNIQVKAKK